MLKSCLKYILVIFFTVPIFFLASSPVYASRIVNSVTLNGSSSVTVAPSASITAAVNVTTIADGGGATWGSTRWTVNGVDTCVDIPSPNHTTAGTYSDSFTITAPASLGTYDATFTVFVTNSCGTGAASYTLTGGIIVSSATPTPTPTPTSSPTPTPGSTATSTPTPGPGTSTAIPTPTPSSSSSSSSTSSVTYSPSVSLNTYSPNPTNKTTLTFTGTATIEQGTINLVEFTLTDGAQWFTASANDGTFNAKEESFTFITPQLSEGTYTIKVRAKSQAGEHTQSGSYATDSVTIITTPPTVNLDNFPQNPTNDLTPTITGNVIPRLGTIIRTEVSLDNGRTWIPVSRTSGRFQLTAEELEDGNYQVLARTFDNAGNIGSSALQTLVVDTIPPIIGGGMQALGPLVLTPNSKGEISVVAGAEITIAMSMKGGVTQALVKTDNETFNLSQQEGTNIWVGKVKFESEGEKQLTISAIDGASNKTDRPFNTLLVEQFGTIEEKDTNQKIKNADVSLYYFEAITQAWVLWEGKSYGQQNPQKTNDDGSYSFMVPTGKYYVEVKALGYYKAQSEILTLTETAMINFSVPLRSKPKLTFNLPVFGEVILTIPELTPPDTIPAQPTVKQSATAQTTPSLVGMQAPQFVLPNFDNNDISLSTYKGKKMVLTFLSPWSSLSLEQASFLSSLANNLPDSTSMLAISLQESLATTQTFMQRGNYSFPVVADRDGKTATDYNVTVLPHHYFIDTTGKVHEIVTGVLSKDEIINKLVNMP